jgi:hypothetical protein
MLHLVSGVLLERSHALAGTKPPALAALDDETTACSAAVEPPQPSLPYD